MSRTRSAAVSTARDYYNSADADTFYATIWGGEDIHVGIYEHADEDIAIASRRTVERLAEAAGVGAGDRVLDIGAGFGGAARHLARATGAQVTCLNLSEVENERNRRMTAEQGLDGLVDVVDGAFEDLPFDDGSQDVVWSQDAFLHSDDRPRVLAEARRALRPGGRLVFTDPMATAAATTEDLAPILRRIQLDTMATPELYRAELDRLGFEDIGFDDMAGQLPTHYGRVLAETERREAELAGLVSADYLAAMKAGLRHWVDGGHAGNLSWGIFRARR